jgi:hypothetical protein
MKVIDIIRNVLNLIDSAENQSTPEVAVVTDEPTEPDSLDIEYLVKLAGLETKSDDSEVIYNNEPNEQYRGVASIVATGTDINKSKHPADIRTNAASMFPDFQARRN